MISLLKYWLRYGDPQRGYYTAGKWYTAPSLLPASLWPTYHEHPIPGYWALVWLGVVLYYPYTRYD